MSEDRSQWRRCRHWIEAALPYTRGTHTIEDIEDGIASGQFIFWAGERSALITEILNYPRRRVFHVFLAGGDLRELVDYMEPRLALWAKQHGCSAISIAGRDGFARALQAAGFEPGWRVIIKEL